MGAVVNKGKKVPVDAKKPPEAKEEKVDKGECVQVVCKHGEESRAYNARVELHMPVKEVWQFLEKEVVKERLFELGTSNTIKYIIFSCSFFAFCIPSVY
jgi:hypothetical protein